MQDFNHLVKHLNTSFKFLDVARTQTVDRSADALRLSRLSSIDTKTAQNPIKLEDCLVYDHQNDVFQLNTIPLKILLLQDKRHLVQKYILESMELVWQHKSIIATMNPTKVSSSQVDLYSF